MTNTADFFKDIYLLIWYIMTGLKDICLVVQCIMTLIRRAHCARPSLAETIEYIMDCKPEVHCGLKFQSNFVHLTILQLPTIYLLQSY